MDHVDYLKLSEQYAGFLVAVGGVSITVLTLVLSLDYGSKRPLKGHDLRSFLIAALTAGAVACFVGAHMMAETAAFISQSKEEAARPPIEQSKEAAERLLIDQTEVGAERLFLFASVNIFIAIILVLFALMLLPAASGKVDASSGVGGFSAGIFLLILCGGVYWVYLASKHRMPVPESWRAACFAAGCWFVWAFVLLYVWWPRKDLLRRCMLWATFAPSAVATVVSLVWFAQIFKDGDAVSLKEARVEEIGFFSTAIVLSYTSLGAAGAMTMFTKRPAARKSRGGAPTQNPTEPDKGVAGGKGEKESGAEKAGGVESARVPRGA
jgi:hypothetical protein